MTILTNTDNMVPIPESWSVEPFEHQRSLVYHCINLENHPTILSPVGLIGDDVGAGKSYSVLLLCQTPITKKYIVPGEICILEEREHNGCNLIIVPHNLIPQWIGYIKKTNMEYTVINSAKNCDNEPKLITLVSATMYSKYCLKRTGNHLFMRVFIDEIDSIRITGCSTKTDSIMTWFVTATYASIINRSIMTHLRSKRFYEHRLGLLSRNYFSRSEELCFVNSEEIVRRSMQIPDPINIEIICKRNMETIRNIVPVTVFEMIEAGDLNGAITLMGSDTVDSEEGIIALLTDCLTREMNSKKEELVVLKDTLALRIRHNMNRGHFPYSITRKEQEISALQTKIDGIAARLSESNLCPISMDTINTPAIVKCCANKFDLNSIMDYIRSVRNARCPFCRSALNFDNMIVMHNDETNASENTAEDPPENTDIDFSRLSKLDACRTLIENGYNDLSMGNKIIVFTASDFTSTLFECKLLKGCSSHQSKVIDWFNEDTEERRIIFINSRFNAAGLNLHKATSAIVFSSANEYNIKQAIGRAQRFPRTVPLVVAMLR